MDKKIVLESDRRLIEFRTYDAYLDSIVSKIDVCYFRNYFAARKIAELGYRSSGDMLSKEEFYRKLADVMEILFSSRKPYELCSYILTSKDDFLNQLANREKSNRIGLVATIIFIRYFSKSGHELSGYIDYADRLLNEDWRPIFSGRKKLRLKQSDLSYFNWRNNKNYYNHSNNYWVLFDSYKGLVFQHRHDRKTVLVDPSAPSPGQDTQRGRIFTTFFDHVILYDHYVRRQA